MQYVGTAFESIRKWTEQHGTMTLHSNAECENLIRCMWPLNVCVGTNDN